MAGSESTATVLVVDDESSIREMVSERLRSRGYVVLTASSGPEALALGAGERKIDLLLTDLIMPGMTGRALADAMHARSKDMAVIFMSGYIDGRRSAELDQDVSFIQKPLDWQKLETMVRELLMHRKTP